MRNWLLVLWRAKFRTEWERGDRLGNYKTWLMREVRRRWDRLGERQKWNLQTKWQQGVRRPLDDQDDAALNEDPTVFEADSAISDLDDSIEEELKNRHDLDCFELQEVPREELLEPASEQVDGASHVGAAALPIAEVDEAPAGDVAEPASELVMWLKRLKEDSHVDVAAPASEQVTEAAAGDAADPTSASSTSLPAIVSGETYPMAALSATVATTAFTSSSALSGCSTETEDGSNDSSCDGKQMLLCCNSLTGEQVLVEVDVDASVGQIHAKIRAKTGNYNDKTKLEVLYAGRRFESEYDKIMLTLVMRTARSRTTPIKITTIFIDPITVHLMSGMKFLVSMESKTERIGEFKQRLAKEMLWQKYKNHARSRLLDSENKELYSHQKLSEAGVRSGSVLWCVFDDDATPELLRFCSVERLELFGFPETG